MKFAKFLRTPFYRTPPVAASGNESSIVSNVTGYIFYLKNRTSFTRDFRATCKPWHWNLGIGIGIGTDVTNVIISSFIRPTDPKLIRVVTLDERPPPTKSREFSISWSRDK